jgi:hypothetical protein
VLICSAGTVVSYHSEHVASYATLHGIRLAIFIFNSGGSSISRHLFQALAKFGVGLGDGFGFWREGMALIVLV